MNQAEMTKRVEQLLNDEGFKNKFFALKSAEEMSDELAKHEIDLSAEDLRKVKQLLKKKEDGELTDEDLENVAGGFFSLPMIAAIGIACATGGGYGAYRIATC